MEEAPVHAVQKNGFASHTSRPSGSIATCEDDGSSDDPPPIPCAGSSSYLTSQSVGENRLNNPNKNHHHHDPAEVHTLAHTLASGQVAEQLETNVERGLTTQEATERLRQYGHNKLETSGGVSWWRILLRQVSNSLTFVLAIAMILSFVTLDFIEGGVIAAVIFSTGYGRAALRVIRDSGTSITINADELVPGDVVVLAVGDIVPTDVRLTSTINFATDEALLTGESKPCTKDAEASLEDMDSPIGDRINMAYSSTNVTRGRAVGIAVSTGMKTEIGKIAELLKDKDAMTEKEGFWLFRFGRKIIFNVKSALGLIGTPLQVKLSWFALLLFALAILLAIIVFSANAWDVDDETLIYGICTAVAVIPESLIAVLTIVIAVGSKAMAKSNVIVRKMGALEAIGGVTNICSDKTGTLTQGKMLARKAFLPNGEHMVVQNETGPFDPTSGEIASQGVTLTEQSASQNQQMRDFFHTISLCNLANVIPPSAQGGDATATWTATGEPTEIALQVMAMRIAYGKQQVLDREGLSLITEHSFDSSIKRMSVIYQSHDEKHLEVFTKGATEVLLPLTDVPVSARQTILEQADSMASQGLRVLCLARRQLPITARHSVDDRASIEQELTFAGLVGLYDPPRLESADAIRQCQAAGITVHMLTGDHLKTATTIAQEIGILGPHVYGSMTSSSVMVAQDFDKFTDEAIDDMKTLPLVLARCSPSTKLRMLHALHRRGKYCVMTGDGTNDSPALKGADVGVAMGMNGSDVSKEAADMVLTDDNFASIVSAIREGRRLFDNIQKFLLHLLTSNISQIILLLVGLAFQDRRGISVFPLSPIEILWANLITSSFLAIGLGLEEASADVMLRPPHSLTTGVFTTELIVDKFIYGGITGILSLVCYVIVIVGVGNGDLGEDCNESYNETCDLAFKARGTAYAIMTVQITLMALEAKHLTLGLFNMHTEGNAFTGFFRTLYKNKFLFWSSVVGMITPFPAVFIPVVNKTVFRHLPLTWEWALVFGSSVLFVVLVEAWKAAKRVKRSRDERKRQVVNTEKQVEKSEESSIV
ncbi:Na(+)/Li(+)-exporting P-type ATPase [Hortaea werneckii]|uniref:P-type Na(+) transporter n=1 Tax=Hortaea werneckii TaxID=91943 RepID=A0A3M6ZPG3_HORWE|nr:Na(+)/Li(+)-exporting P-type ATPase [Hortaea werneckii]KAI7668916.1 Na(+)/Li(+)-exporting P-type ATPase [Hortaea werneckii]RMY17163.1 hypothetical protein D0867_06230 [Hortaea werneckii]